MAVSNDARQPACGLAFGQVAGLLRGGFLPRMQPFPQLNATESSMLQKAFQSSENKAVTIFVVLFAVIHFVAIYLFDIVG
jgi:hypothetical protein